MPALENGWAYDKYTWSATTHGIQTDLLGGMAGSSDQMYLEIPWGTAFAWMDFQQHHTPSNESSYELAVTITGPKGVPYL